MRFSYLAPGLMLFLLASLWYFGRVDVNIVYGGDTWGYYGYLPAAFVYGDLDHPTRTYLARFDYADGPPALPAKGGELTETEDGGYVIKYTVGVALLQAPFFAVAHGLAHLLPAVPVDGYSRPYRWAINLSVLLWFLPGMWWLYRVLREEVDERVAGWTILLVTLGTPLYDFLVFRGPMAHGYLFSLYAGLMYYSARFYRGGGTGSAIGIGLTAGLITLIRPVEGICLLIPLLYGTMGTRERWRYWRERFSRIALAALVYALVGSAQLFYWKYATGNWLFFSYGEERFYWSDPQLWRGLLGFRNGWLPYSPLSVLALIGIGWLFRYRNWLGPVLTWLPLHIYITYSWWNWYYINGFGSRPMVEAGALLAVPLAFLLRAAWRRVWSRWLVGGLCTFFVLLMLFQHEQHQRGVLWPEMGNAAYYWSVVGRLEPSPASLTAYESNELQPAADRLAFVAELYANDFEGDTSAFAQSEHVGSGRRALRLDPEPKYYDIGEFPLADYPLAPGDYVRIEARCFKLSKEAPNYLMPAFVVEWNRADGSHRKYRPFRIDSHLGNADGNLWGGQAGVWDTVSAFFRIPRHQTPGDYLKIYVAASQEPVFVDDIRVTVWRKP